MTDHPQDLSILIDETKDHIVLNHALALRSECMLERGFHRDELRRLRQRMVALRLQRMHAQQHAPVQSVARHSDLELSPAEVWHGIRHGIIAPTDAPAHARAFGERPLTLADGREAC